jgi:hypothetical protein
MFYLPRREEDEREDGEKEKAPPRLDSVHRVHNKQEPIVRGATRMCQIHTFFPFDLNFWLSSV